MKTLDNLLDEFKLTAIQHFEYTKEGDHKRVNAGVKKTEKIFKKIKELNGRDELLDLIYSDNPAIASMAAVYSLKYNPNECLKVFEQLSKANIPFISMGAEYAIRNWESGQWDID